MSEDDMMKTIVPKSDQLNADDLVGGHTITIKINRAEVKETGEQKVILGYEGDKGKPYKPGKMMCHVLIGLYGKSSKNYVGKSLTLYRDDAVTFGPNQVGGVRISHASHIDNPRTIIVPVSKGVRKPFTVKPLVVAEPQIDHALEIIKRNARDNAINGTENLQKWWTTLPKESQAKLKPYMEEYKKIAKETDNGQKDKIPAGNGSAMGEGLAIEQGDERGNNGADGDKPDGANEAVEGAGK